MRKPWRAQLPTLLVMLAFVCAVGATAVRTFWDIKIDDASRDHYGMKDFRDAIYYPVIAVRDGNNPYDVPSYRARYPIAIRFPLYAPITLLIHSPLSLLTPRRAEHVYFALNVILALVVAHLGLAIAGLRSSTLRIFGIATAIVISQAGQMALFLGQSALPMMVAAYGAMSCARSRPALAAAGLAVACSKPTFGVPLAVLMAWRGDWRAVSLGVTAAVALSTAVVIGVLFKNAGGTWPFIESVRNNYLVWGDYPLIDVTHSEFRVDIFVIVGRLLGRALTTVEDLGIAAVVFLLGGWAVHRLARSKHDRHARLSSSLMCLIILAGSYHQVYDALLLLLPVLTVAAGSPALVHGRVRWLLLALLLLPAFNYLVSFTAMEKLNLQEGARFVVTSVNAIAVAGSLLLCVVIGLRRSMHLVMAAPSARPV